jgi:protein O-mannosyl-transferase
MRRWYPVVIVLAVLAAYHGSFTGPFIFDDTSIIDAHELRDPWSWRVLTGTTRPLVQLSFALNYAYGELDVVGYHVVNVAIHALAALGLYAIVARTLAGWPAGTLWHDEAAELALAASLVWAVHPLQTESVTYVVQRAESLMALWYLTTLYAVVRGATSRHRRPWFAAAIVACALGMVTKPVMVTAPIAVMLYDRVFLARSWRELWRSRGVLYLALAGTWLCLVLVVGRPNESAQTAGFAMQDVSFWEFLRTQPGVVLHYLRLVVWPHPLVLDYGWPVANDAVAIVAPTLVLAALGAVTAWAWKRCPSVGFLAVAFFLTLAPSSSVIPIRDLAFEHRMYLPLAPLAVLAVVGVRWVAGHWIRGRAAAERVALAVVAVLVIALTLTTIARNRDYASAITMWSDVVAKRPANARAQSNLGQSLDEAGRSADAIAPLEAAVRLNPGFVDAHLNLGNALANQRRDDAAALHYAEALRLDPSTAKAHNSWGVVLRRQGKLAEAESHYRAALRLNPDLAEAENNLGVVLMDLGRIDEAREHYTRALELAPRYAEVASNFGNLLLREGKAAEAVPYYRRAIRISPAIAEVHLNLALALAATGQREEARAAVEEAVRLKPELRTYARNAGLL